MSRLLFTLIMCCIVALNYGQVKKVGEKKIDNKMNKALPVKTLSKSIAFNNGAVLTSYSYRKKISNCTNFVYFNEDGSVGWEEELCEKAFVSATGLIPFSMAGVKDGSAVYLFNSSFYAKDEIYFYRINNAGEKTALSTKNIPTDIHDVFCAKNNVYARTVDIIDERAHVKLYACSTNEKEFTLLDVDFEGLGGYIGEVNDKAYIYKITRSNWMNYQIKVWEINEKTKDFSFDFSIPNHNMKKKEQLMINSIDISINADKNEIHIIGFTVGDETAHKAIQGFNINYSLEKKSIINQDFKPITEKGLYALYYTKVMDTKNGAVIYNRGKCAVINVEKGRLKEIEVIKVKAENPYEVEIYGTDNYPEIRKYLQANKKTVLDFTYFENTNKFVVLLKGRIIQVLEY